MKTTQRDRQAGVTLLEMLIVVAVISILTAVVYPSYQDYVVRGNRAVGKGALLEVAARQEQFFANNAGYGSGTEQLGYPSTYYVDRKGGQGTSATGIYLIEVDNLTSAPIRDYTLTATPQNFQETRDTECANLTLNERGVKGVEGQTGSGERCWE
jgi:type IV pilus assembly protein PilE